MIHQVAGIPVHSTANRIFHPESLHGCDNNGGFAVKLRPFNIKGRFYVKDIPFL
jgi:hypothetical protein